MTGSATAANQSAFDAAMQQAAMWNRDVVRLSPMFEPLREHIAKLDTCGFPALQDLNMLLASRSTPISVQSGARLAFVPQLSGKLPFEVQYEPSCYLRGEVPTRAANWHDLFNALVWLTFPMSKAAMNGRHYHALMASTADQQESGSERGPVRDVITLLDESGVIVVCSDPELIRLVKEFEWKELFWHRRKSVAECMKFIIIGHGLYEKALRPYVGMTGQGMVLQVGKEFHGWSAECQLAQVDSLVANKLADDGLYRETRELAPIPILGIPGWSWDNVEPGYYDNTSYFRRGRRCRPVN